jgi:hypothetical protein
MKVTLADMKLAYPIGVGTATLGPVNEMAHTLGGAQWHPMTFHWGIVYN